MDFPLVCVLFALGLMQAWSQELRMGDVGVCKTSIPVQTSTKITYKCKNNKNGICRKNKTINKMMPACCRGWTFNMNLNICVREYCDPGLVILNHTLCAPPCPPGEYNDPLDGALSCRSLCSQPCINSNCTGIDDCTCFTGYKKLGQYECEAICERCENGTCMAPGDCRCHEGYQRLDGQCKPVCEGCEHGVCVSPGNCNCDEGYVSTDGKCKPICDKCGHGICVSPGNCDCHEGYIKINGECNPDCEECEHGTCIGPGNCSCHEGYTKINGKCEPFCGQCDHGICISPGNCSCVAGYANTNGKCKPICDGCENGFCVSPGNCYCYEGYITTDGKCKPDCKGCEHGTCVEPGNCKCHEGYAKLNGKCKPVCNKCRHGTCVQPDKCECSSGLTLIDDECEPVCEEKCQNGNCTGPNECTCAPKYIRDERNKFKCNPICTHGCDNGVCSPVVPDKCDCNEGFQEGDNSWTCVHKCDKGYIWDAQDKTCNPVCDESCANATCVAPNLCKCLKGYDRANATSPCEPVCKSCSGQCVAPGECLYIVSCKECEGICHEGECACANGTVCQEMQLEAAGVASDPTLASIQITWALGGAIAILLLVIIAVVIRHIYRKNSFDQKTQAVDANAYGSVVYTVPNTLTSPEDRMYREDDYDDLESQPNELGPLRPNEEVERL